MSARQVLLVGAGHAHLQVIGQAARFRAASIELAVVEPGSFWYSGMATGLLSGAYERDDDRIALGRWCAHHGVARIADRAIGLDHRHRRLWLASGQPMAYDAISFNVGSEVSLQAFSGGQREANVWPVKPVRTLWLLRNALLDDMRRGAGGHIAIVGGGATGCEVAANIAALTAGSGFRVALYTRASRLWPDAPRPAARRLARELARRGVDIVFDTSIAGKAGRRLLAVDGRQFTVDHMVLATGLTAPGVMQASDLAADAQGLHVGARLHAPTDTRVFAVGDCAQFLPRPLPKLGVHAVRQAPVLAHNLIAGLTRRPYMSYRPRTRHLMILDMGDGTALARRGRFWWHGGLSLAWKRGLDFGFMARYRA